MWDDYAAPGGTYRENMLRIPGQTATTEGHRSKAFTFEALRDNLDEDGVITINRQDQENEEDVVENVEEKLNGKETRGNVEKRVAEKVEENGTKRRSKRVCK